MPVAPVNTNLTDHQALTAHSVLNEIGGMKLGASPPGRWSFFAGRSIFL